MTAPSTTRPVRLFRLLALSCSALMCVTAVAAKEVDLDLPWFTGPLLVPTATMSGAGEMWIQPFLFAGEGLGIASGGVSLHKSTVETTLNPQLLVGYGISDRFEVQIDIQAIWNIETDADSIGAGDTAIELHYLVVDEDADSWRPALRADFIQYFPTGTYQNLRAENQGTDAHGTGSFAPIVVLNLTKTLLLANGSFLRPHFSLVYAMPLDTHVRGLNTYGGGQGTDGAVRVGNSITAFVSGEYSLTPHWSLALDTTYTYVDSSRFNGNPGVNADGSAAMVGSASGYQITIAPQIEYCIDANQGVIVGPWVTVAGRNTQDFVNLVVSYVATFDVGTPW